VEHESPVDQRIYDMCLAEDFTIQKMEAICIGFSGYIRYLIWDDRQDVPVYLAFPTDNGIRYNPRSVRHKLRMWRKRGAR